MLSKPLLNFYFDLLPCEVKESPNQLIITKWNWDYQKAQQTQNWLVSQIEKNPELRVDIFCSHPPLFTVGKGKEAQAYKQASGLLYPIHFIHRGGGLTFHHPGQWIHYRLHKLDIHKITLKQHVQTLLNEGAKRLASFGFQVEEKMEPLGLWKEGNKIASLGVGVKKFITLHGLALNLQEHDIMHSGIKNLNPCGLSSSLYKSLSHWGKEVSPQDFNALKTSL